MNFGRQVNVKTTEELQTMRASGRINAEILATVKNLIQPGVSTADLNAAAEEVLKKHGCYSPFKGYSKPPFPASICTSVNEEMVHGIPSKKRILREGDIVSVDSGTVFQGFVSDSAFTAGVGVISEEASRLLEITEGALYAAIDKMRVGNRTGDVSAAIQEYVESRGLHVTREYTSHGVGRQMHEAPMVPNFGTAGTGLPLRPGMTIAIEPMVLIGTHETRVLRDQWTVISADKSLTAHFEHSVAVTDGDPLILTVP
ncbi:MAG: type I methionyl aminopeptidase [Chloroflexi bacterium]|nr:type I methionyl aminopeptidase [Chloroflexota bacterium]MBI3340859.1 type I methionyl aminopeptidase [Chloroflexota bacterium]